MAAALTVTGIALVLFLPTAQLLSAELRFVDQTHFRVNETSQTIVRLVVERVGDPVNVTALVLVRSDLSGLLSGLLACMRIVKYFVVSFVLEHL